MSTIARQVVLSSRPNPTPKAADFRIDEIELPEPRDGEVLVKANWLSLDPYMRLYMSDQQGLHASHPLGIPMPGGMVGEVVTSASDALPVGSLVMSMAHGWRDYFVSPAEELQPISAEAGAVQRFLGLYGLTGVTAWGGIKSVLKPQPGEVLLINGAAGAVGSIALQLAKREGAVVIACAGSDTKGEWLTSKLGADYFVNYRTEDVAKRLIELAPDGIEMFFDNVGGEQLEIAIESMKPEGRIALCGAVALYDTENYRAGPRNLFSIIEKHVSVTGFNAGFYFDKASEIIAEYAELEASGKLIYEETVIDGLDAMPQGFVDMLAGKNTGKMLVRL